LSFVDVTIDEITDVVTKGTTPTTYGMPFTDDGVNFVKAEALNGDVRLDRSGFTFVSEETHEKLKRSQLHKDDVLITIAGANVGKCGFVKESDLPANTNQAVGIVRVNQKQAWPRFVYYHFKNPATFAISQNMSGQAAQPNINLTVLKGFKLQLPDYDVQKKIAEKLTAYDDLIENNRRRIQLLEESARLLYKEWFVQLRFPGHEHVKIVDGVPEGWAHLTVGTLLGKIKRKGKVKKDDYKADGVLACVDQSKEFIGGYIDSTELAIVDELPILVFGDHTRVVKYIDFPFAPGADGTQLLIPKSNEIPRVFFYFLIAGINLANAFYARHFKFLKATEVLVPKKELMRLFEDSVSTNMNQISLLREQNKKLSKARDILLPRLMNGTLTV